MLYSIIETAKIDGIIHFDYITHCLGQVNGDEDEDTIKAMLPWNVKLG